MKAMSIRINLGTYNRLTLHSEHLQRSMQELAEWYLNYAMIAQERDGECRRPIPSGEQVKISAEQWRVR